MPARTITPGFGGQYTSENITGTAVAADTMDVSNLTSIAIQQELTGSPGGSFQMEETFDGSNWANLGGAITVSDGAITKFDEAGEGPFGRIRINPASVTGLSSTVFFSIRITGFVQKVK